MRRLGLIAAAVLIAACSSADKNGLKTQELPGMGGEASTGLFAVLRTSQGEIEIRLFPEEAPKTVENFVALAKGGKPWTDPKTKTTTTAPLYDGTLFHRVLPGFMIQGGDPLGTGAGGPGYVFADEFYQGRLFNKPGILAMANAGPDSNGSQFFITLSPAPWLDNRHTIFGQVVRGMESVEAIAGVSRDARDRPLEDQILRSISIEER